MDLYKRDMYFGSKPAIPKLIDLVREREIKDSMAKTLALKRHVTKDLVSRLGLEKELEGHQGCVNCLQWSDSGEILASASDDMHIFIWNPFSYKKLYSFNTGHNGNIFSVNFMPKSNNNIVVSGAADAKVKVFNLKLAELLYTCSCHVSRVKRIATAGNVPYLFWSAAEDGLILQHDLRTPHTCSTNHKTILVNLMRYVGSNVEAKCMAINPMRPELVAIGANDPYIRMFDRRMIKLDQGPVGTFSASYANEPEMPIDCAQYLIAGHLRWHYRYPMRNFAATYVTFSGDGTELLVNMGGEQIYLFDIMKPNRSNNTFNVPTTESKSGKKAFRRNNSASPIPSSDSNNGRDYSSMNLKVLPHHVEELKLEANNKYQMDKYIAAINLYNTALGFCPMASVLYGNRAAAFMKRKWDGDIYAALRDCQTTLLLDPEHVKAHFRLARCLFDLNCPREAYRVIKNFQEKFPEYGSNEARLTLENEIKKALNPDKQEYKLEYSETLSSQENAWRRQAIDYKYRYCGHCNTTTDIKEANFFGSEGQYIIAGSDDGNIFIWDRYTTNIVRVLGGDSRIVNCLQPHPSSCFLATSGIDPVIRLWSPLPEDDKPNERAVTNTDEVAQTNQIRMRSDPFALMMMNMGYNLASSSQLFNDEVEAEDQNDSVDYHRTCRPS